MKLSLFDYNLPRELIAQKQIKPRDHSRLLVLNRPSLPSSPRLRRTGELRTAGRKTAKITHDYFYNLDKYLNKGDVLVLNNSKVFPARIKFDKNKEIFLLSKLDNGNWEIIGKKLEIRNQKLGGGLECNILKRVENGNWEVKFNLQGERFREVLEKIGETPLPPYIKTKDSKQIRKDYQTVYAKEEGSVAAPTAGLHFTKRVFEKLKKKGVKIEYVTLHVGQGTFAPVKTENIEEHKMHAEYVVLDKATIDRLNKYKKEGRRIIAAGTTSCRVLEALASETGKLKVPSSAKATEDYINIFIYPGYEFKFVDSLITNFHLSKSSLLMLVSALAGRKLILKVYKEAIRKKYRFYSFGDSMFIK